MHSYLFIRYVKKIFLLSVFRVAHPDWLHKKVLERNDSTKQRRITDMFAKVDRAQHAEPEEPMQDIEDFGRPSADGNGPGPRVTVSGKRKRDEGEAQNENFGKSWRDVLGDPPAMGSTKVGCLKLI